MGFLSPSAPSQGYNYFGSFAILACIGPVKRLNGIYNGDTQIFTGPIDATGADGDGKTTVTTSIGTLDFYWGSATQNVNSGLNSLEIDLGSGAVNVPMPAFRNCCYAVLHDGAFGSQVAPPTLKFDVETETAGLALSAHSINSDAVIPEAVFQFLTNSLYGHGISSDDIDAASFAAAAETVIAEGLGASPDLDTTEDSRTILGRMLSHVDGYLYFHAGKLRLKLIRKEDTSSAPSIAEADLLDEPEPNNKLFAETWSETRVAFKDSDTNWQDDVEPWHNEATAQLTGQNVTKEFSLPYFTRRRCAKVFAKLLGIKGGIPPVYWTLQLKPQWRTLAPGDLFKLSFAKLGISNRVCRVTEIKRGQPSKPGVQVTCIEEQTRSTTHDYTPPADSFTVPTFVDANGSADFTNDSTTPRLSQLPTALKGGKADGVLVAMNRPDPTTSGALVYWTWDEGSWAYQQIIAQKTFPAKCQLLAWWQIRTGNWLLRVQPDTPLDYSRLQGLADNATDVFAVVGRRDYKSTGTPLNQHRALCPWLSKTVAGRFTLLSSEWIDIEVTGGAWGTPDLLLETLGANALYPTVHCYFGRKEDFALYTSDGWAFDRNQGNSPIDTDLKRFIKATIGNWRGQQAIGDVSSTYFDRNDSTMSPDGTLQRDWGALALTAYELYDDAAGIVLQGGTSPDYPTVTDLDAALGRVLDRSASADDQLLVEHIDNVLGAMISTTQQFYNE